jgi:pyrimidine-nucleoside phosphorylase
MRAVDIIRKKRDGHTLSGDEIKYLVNGYCQETIPDYQVSSFLMSVYYQGLSPIETADLTRAMIDSGSTLDFSQFDGVKVDKHSTGGVGDKVSLVAAPVVASLGGFVPMMSGRGLGHTGGTLDKLESIPGFTVQLQRSDMDRIMDGCGYIMMGQTEDMVPADKRMYALRDVTATVESISLITASILSKKFAEGTEGLVMDLKCGTGAFMKNIEQSRSLGNSLLQTGRELGLDVRIVVTDMNRPLGTRIGNLNEVLEALEALQGYMVDDFKEVTLEITANMLVQAGIVPTVSDGIVAAEKSLQDGSAFKAFCRNVELQGGDLTYTDVSKIKKELAKTEHETIIVAKQKGWISGLDAYKTGQAAMLLGAGRATVTDTIDYLCGIEVLGGFGTTVEKGEPVLKLTYNRDDNLEMAVTLCNDAIQVSDSPIKVGSSILETID